MRIVGLAIAWAVLALVTAIVVFTIVTDALKTT